MKWKNWVDYWSVDFDFQSKQEILKMRIIKKNGLAIIYLK